MSGQSLGHIAASGARVVGNSLLQVGDALTGGYNHDHPAIQQAWSEQQAIGEALVRLMRNDLRETASHAIEQIVKRYQAAKSIPDPYEQSRALGQLYSDVGQAAVGLGHVTVTLSKAGVVGIEVAFARASAGFLSKLSRADIKNILTSATMPYKGTTVVGHALSKHAGRNPEIWGKIEGAQSTWNE